VFSDVQQTTLTGHQNMNVINTKKLDNYDINKSQKFSSI